MTSNAPKAVRCAIYTRVSTDSGLDQEFNSLGCRPIRSRRWSLMH